VWAFDVERCLPSGSQTEPEVSGLRPVEHRMLFEAGISLYSRPAQIVEGPWNLKTRINLLGALALDSTNRSAKLFLKLLKNSEVSKKISVHSNAGAGIERPESPFYKEGVKFEFLYDYGRVFKRPFGPKFLCFRHPFSKIFGIIEFRFLKKLV
jgi:hypothetical protein